MLNKSHRSVVSTCVFIFMPYFKKKKKTIKNSFFQKKTLVFFFFFFKHDLKKTVFFHITSNDTNGDHITVVASVKAFKKPKTMPKKWLFAEGKR